MGDAPLRILIAEDQLLIALNLRHKLSEAGYDVLEPVVSGEEAIRSALENRPDLIIMEINLAGEVDGFQAVAEIHRHIKIPVLFHTGYSDSRTLNAVRAFDPAAVVNKPISSDKLLEAIQQMFILVR